MLGHTKCTRSYWGPGRDGSLFKHSKVLHLYWADFSHVVLAFCFHSSVADATLVKLNEKIKTDGDQAWINGPEICLQWHTPVIVQ